MNESKLKLGSGLINDSDSSSADYALCPAAAENTGVPGFQRRALMASVLLLKLRVPWRIRPRDLLPNR